MYVFLSNCFVIDKMIYNAYSYYNDYKIDITFFITSNQETLKIPVQCLEGYNSYLQGINFCEYLFL